MSETIHIAQQMKQGFEKDCWSGPSLLEVLDGVDHKMASAKPIPNAHTIWEIVMHLIAGQSLMLRMVQGDIAQRVAVGDCVRRSQTNQGQLDRHTRATQETGEGATEGRGKIPRRSS